MNNQQENDEKDRSFGNNEPSRPGQETGQPKATQNSNENSASGANKVNPGSYNAHDTNTGSRSSAQQGSEGNQGKGDGHGFGGAGMSSSPEFNDGSHGQPGRSENQDKREWHDLSGQEHGNKTRKSDDAANGHRSPSDEDRS